MIKGVMLINYNLVINR